MPRLLSLLNKHPFSENFGCFDRDYWHYKNTDFPCARKQEAALTLAYLYRIDSKRNIYFKNKNILNWINSALDFWTKIQEKDGSFNEWYPHEKSFVATAFSSYAVSETLLLLKNNEITNRKKIINSLKKSNNWLLKKKEKRAMNQTCGAALSLFNIYLLTKEIKYKKVAENKIKFIIKNQNKEGWWEEYCGSDIGYLSLAIDYLAKFYKKSKNNELLETLNKAVRFIKYFISPNLTFGGEYGSRNTEYLIPHGFEVLAKTNKAASAIAYSIREVLKKKTSISPHSLDDRYLLYITYTWLQAYLDSCNLKNKIPVYKANFEKTFSGCGIYIKSTAKFYLIFNYKKSSFKIVFKKNDNVVYDSGILVETEKKKLCSFWSDNNVISKIPKNGIMSRGPMAEFKEVALSPIKNIGLRFFQETIGKQEKTSKFVKEKLRDLLITENKKTSAKFERKIFLDEDNIKITDKISTGDRIKRMLIGAKFSSIYTPSSRYFQISELKNSPVIIDKIRGRNAIIERNYCLDGTIKNVDVKNEN